MRFLRFFWNWFLSKKMLVNVISDMQKVIDDDIVGAVKRVEELDQNKVYVVKIGKGSKKNILLFQSVLAEVQKGMKWSMPKIFIVNKELVEVGESELVSALKKIKSK